MCAIATYSQELLVVAAFLAVAATFVTAEIMRRGVKQQLEQSDEHVRLSVTPLLGFRAYFEKSGHRAEAGIFLANNGIGPAIITSMAAYVDGKRMLSTDMPHDQQTLAWKAILVMLGFPENVDWLSYSTFSTPEAIQEGTHRAILYITPVNQTEDARIDLLRKAQMRLDILVDAESLYRQPIHIAMREPSRPSSSVS